MILQGVAVHLLQDRDNRRIYVIDDAKLKDVTDVDTGGAGGGWWLGSTAIDKGRP